MALLGAASRLLSRGLAVARSWLPGASSSALQRIGKRLNISNVTPDKILSHMKENKLGTALVLYEMGDAGAEVLNEMISADDDIAGIIEQIRFEQDTVEDTSSVQDIARFSEEFDVITQGIRAFGSMERALAIRNFMTVDQDTINLYLQVYGLSRGMVR